MSEYIFVLLWIGAFAFIARAVQFKRTKLIEGVEVERYVFLFAFLVFAPVIYYAGTRSSSFADTWAYRNAFLQMPNNVGGLRDYLDTIGKDKGFYFLSSLFKIFISNNHKDFFKAIALIQGILVVWFFRNYSRSYFLSVFFFVASTDYISWMFNGIRQFTAVTIVLLCVPFLLKRKMLPTILIIVGASMIHFSAIIMLPLVFLVKGEVFNKKTIIFSVIVILAVVFVDSFTEILRDSLLVTQYHSKVDEYESLGSSGTNVLRVVFYSIPGIMVIVFRKHINAKATPLIKICANFSIVAMGFYVISMFTSGAYLGRLPIYANMFSYILLPWLIDEILHKDYKTFFLVGLVLLYLVFYFIQMKLKWGLI